MNTTNVNLENYITTRTQLKMEQKKMFAIDRDAMGLAIVHFGMMITIKLFITGNSGRTSSAQNGKISREIQAS